MKRWLFREITHSHVEIGIWFHCELRLENVLNFNIMTWCLSWLCAPFPWCAKLSLMFVLRKLHFMEIWVHVTQWLWLFETTIDRFHIWSFPTSTSICMNTDVRDSTWCTMILERAARWHHDMYLSWTGKQQCAAACSGDQQTSLQDSTSHVHERWCCDLLADAVHRERGCHASTGPCLQSTASHW